jgi:hypothetical protein
MLIRWRVIVFGEDLVARAFLAEVWPASVNVRDAATRCKPSAVKLTTDLIFKRESPFRAVMPARRRLPGL